MEPGWKKVRTLRDDLRDLLVRMLGTVYKQIFQDIDEQARMSEDLNFRNPHTFSEGTTGPIYITVSPITVPEKARQDPYMETCINLNTKR